ncbi:hypothetical protein [Microbulbifer sp. GL-2]|uniref:hypothetical protein n=1 Tax=Microbulbifer sp. GL-2 TaxID=2591606 RepID=UPI0011644EB4|nr:hypothetical protein [Microbulbifer sp. GL-2]BBM02394.1 hypothetical protein GL2_24680 [Microbulbifer sp. GL-2]
MVRREVQMPEELIGSLSEIVSKEGYSLLENVFSNVGKGSIFLSQEEAEGLVTLAVIEKKKGWLKYPFYDDEDHRYDPCHEEMFDDIQMGLYEKTIYYIESAFKKGDFDHLL